MIMFFCLKIGHERNWNQMDKKVIYKMEFRVGGIAHVIEHLPSMYEVLGSIPSMRGSGDRKSSSNSPAPFSPSPEKQPQPHCHHEEEEGSTEALPNPLQS